MAVVQRVIEDTGADTDTFCKWLMSSKVKVGGPLSGICHWFTSPERNTERRNSRYNILTHRHDLSRHEYDIMSSSGPQRTSTYSSSHINESTSISIIMILATVLFILLITAFVTCIIRKKRRPQVIRSSLFPLLDVNNRGRAAFYFTTILHGTRSSLILSLLYTCQNV